MSLNESSSLENTTPEQMGSRIDAGCYLRGFTGIQEELTNGVDQGWWSLRTAEQTCMNDLNY